MWKKFRYIFLLSIIVLGGRSYAQSLSLPADGKDFFVGYIYPSYNKVAHSSTGGFYGAYILVSSYSDNYITVSYFDRQTGVEVQGKRYVVPARTGIQIPLDLSQIKMADSGDVAEYGACHVTADRAVNVEFFSTGACAGGSYLALATPVLGKKYVVASYNDNPGNGGLLGGSLGPSSLEISHGCFEIVAPYDNTIVTIIPNATTMKGHIGVNSGAGAKGVAIPYTVILNRGQCYLVKSGSDDNLTDISGSIVESNKPIAVLGAHEDAFLGGVSGRNLEGRDFMIEQMIPVEYWDTTGYVSIPLKDSQPADPNTYEGVGENYRVYAYDSLGSKVKCYDQCLNSPVDLAIARYAHPVPERIGVTCPVDFETTNGKKFSVMMYDQRNFATAAPYPAPSMMTIVPMSHWRTSYLWYVPANKFETLQGYYVNIICEKGDLDTVIKGSLNGGQIKPIKTVLSLGAQFQSIPNYPNLMGQQFQLSPGSYYAVGTRPFMIYSYGFRALDPNFDLGDFDGDDFFFSYAAPVGMKLGAGQSHMRVTVDTFCAYWNVCVHDSIPGGAIRSVTLLDDTAGNFVKPGFQYANSRIDDSLDPDHTNEIYFSENDSNVCLKVLVNNPINSAYAPLFITDDQGNAKIIELHYQSLLLKLIPDNGRYLKSRIGRDSCSKYVFYNIGDTKHQSGDTTKTGKDSVVHRGSPFNITSAKLKRNSQSFRVANTIPSLPTSIKVGDSLVIDVCFSANDTTLQKDTLDLITDCYMLPIALIGQAAIPIIIAGNRDFGTVIVDSTKCDTVSIRNNGNAPLILNNTYRLSNTINFSFRDSSLLPLVLQPGQVVYLTFCYTPHKEAFDSAIFYWGTNELEPYKHSKKDSTILNGFGVTISGVSSSLDERAFTIIPNPASGNSVIVALSDDITTKADLRIYDILGREVYQKSLYIGTSRIEIPIRKFLSGVYYVQFISDKGMITEKFQIFR